MFVPFLIMLREGLEAALIVSLIASYLKRTQRGRWISVMWIGVLLAAALCLGLGIFINETTGEFPQKEQELFEGIVAVIAVVLGFLLYWGGIRLNLGAFFKWTSLFILFVAAGLAAGAIRAFHEAGLWNHFQEIAFDMSAVLSTHSLFGTLMEGIFGYQEAPSVSEVAVWFIYLIPALVAFALPPRAGATASRSA
ncbi:TPA: FTR1 family protein [Escherichia coli]|nr:FTR1 family protein [Escherichia coli]HCO9990863.1 FTR1 family protein [Escherichia coli]